MALPAFREMTLSNRLMTNANDLVATFHQARSEAIRQSSNVGVVACRPDCGVSGTQGWSNGWQIVVGVNPIAEHSAMPQGMTATANGVVPFATQYTYTSQGRLSALTAANDIRLCDDRTGESGRVVRLEPIGRVSISTIACD
jgi:Tfp pilus assembly protein FimT